MRKTTLPVIFLVLIAVFTLLSSLVIVNADEYLIVTQFGRIVSVHGEPGPQLKIPFIQNAQSIPKKKMPIAVVGRSAIITSSMMRDTLEFACACGLELRMKCSAVSFGFIVFSLDHLTT